MSLVRDQEPCVDYQCGKGKLQGKPPPQFQCQRIKRDGLQCRRWRLKGYEYCEVHRKGGHTIKRKVDKLPVLYRYKLRETLQDKVSVLMGENPREALNLFEELALTRIAANQSVMLFDKAHDIENGEKRVEAVAACAAMMSECLKSVQSMCESAARIESQGKDKYSIHSIKVIVDQVVLICHRVFKDYPELVLEFQEAIKQHVRLPDESNGTSITPDQDVLDMDSTIPKGPD